MVFWKRTIIMANKDDHKYCVLTQSCVAFNLILTCRWYVKFDVNVFSNIKTNVAILHNKTDIAHTCCKQLACTILSIFPSPFWGIYKNPKTSVSVSFEFCVDMSGQIPCSDMVFFLNFAPLTKPATFFYHHNDHLLGVVAVKPLLSKWHHNAKRHG